MNRHGVAVYSGWISAMNRPANLSISEDTETERVVMNHACRTSCGIEKESVGHIGEVSQLSAGLVMKRPQR